MIGQLAVFVYIYLQLYTLGYLKQCENYSDFVPYFNESIIYLL